MKKLSIIIASFVLPVVASAAALDSSYIDSILTNIDKWIKAALPIIIAAAVVYFVYGIARFVMAGDEAAKEGAKDRIIYGIVGLFVIVAMWGIVNILISTLGVGNTTIPTTPSALLPVNR